MQPGTATSALVAAFVLTSMNPIGGMTVSVPLAVFKLHWPAWFAVLLGVPLSYVQVLVVDLFWDRLQRWPRWLLFVEKRRSPRLDRIVAHRYAKWLLAIASPWLGPWLVMAVARFGGRRHAELALPLLFGLSYVGVGIAAICVLAPRYLVK
jgi:hypothetical protein